MAVLQYILSELHTLFDVFSRHLPTFVLISTVGIWRWMMWLSKRIPAMFYRPITNEYDCTATVVVAVLRENPVLFRQAIESWIANRPNRIIVVIDLADTSGVCEAIAREYAQVQTFSGPVPGKRAALAAGVDACRTEIVVLADSDVVWDPDVLEKVKMPFADPKIGGVGTRAFMMPSSGKNPTLWERLADAYLDLRYSAEVPATTLVSRAVGCLSGRTSAYRTALLQSLKEPFLNETFLGKPCISGDDKCYTYLVLKKGYNTWCQLNARVHSTFRPDFIGFTQQRIRWSRNSFRSEFRALGEGWIWRYPYLAFVTLDKNMGLLTQLNGPVIFTLAAIHGNLWLMLALVAWWHFTRAVKISSHLSRKPADWLILPLFICATFYLSMVKFYAFFTMNEQGWITRSMPAVDGKMPVINIPNLATTSLPDVNRLPLSITKTLAVAGLIAVVAATVYIHERADGGFHARLYDQPVSALAKQDIEKKYGRLFGALALSPAAQGQLENLLAQRQMAKEKAKGSIVIDWDTIDPTAPVSNSDKAEIVAANSEAVKLINKEIRSEFGRRVAHAISAYEGIAQFYIATDEMRARLSHTPTPLQPAQADQVVGLLVQALGPKVYTSYWAVPDRVITQAASVLSAPQIDVLQQIQQEHEAKIDARDIPPAVNQPP